MHTFRSPAQARDELPRCRALLLAPLSSPCALDPVHSRATVRAYRVSRRAIAMDTQEMGGRTVFITPANPTILRSADKVKIVVPGMGDSISNGTVVQWTKSACGDSFFAHTERGTHACTPNVALTMPTTERLPQCARQTARCSTQTSASMSPRTT